MQFFLYTRAQIDTPAGLEAHYARNNITEVIDRAGETRTRQLWTGTTDLDTSGTTVLLLASFERNGGHSISLDRIIKNTFLMENACSANNELLYALLLSIRDTCFERLSYSKVTPWAMEHGTPRATRRKSGVTGVTDFPRISKAVPHERSVQGT